LTSIGVVKMIDNHLYYIFTGEIYRKNINKIKVISFTSEDISLGTTFIKIE